jgi:cation/acetate symporter
VSLENPGIISIPLGFLGCWLGTMLSREEKPKRSFEELVFRAETGLGAEVPSNGHRPGVRPDAPRREPAVPAGSR